MRTTKCPDGLDFATTPTLVPSVPWPLITDFHKDPLVIQAAPPRARWGDAGDVTLPKWKLDVLLQPSKTRETGRPRETDLDVAEMLI